MMEKRRTLRRYNNKLRVHVHVHRSTKNEMRKIELKGWAYQAQARMLVVPALLDGLAHAFHVFLAIIFVKIRGFDVCGGRCVGVI